MSESNNTYYVSVTIGRNMGDRPMSEKRWDQFRFEAARIVSQSGKLQGQIFSGDGAGLWEDQPEQSYSYAAIVSFDPENVQGDIDTLNARLAYLATLFNQDAIARVLVPLPHGDETLVYADWWPVSGVK